MNVAKTKFMCFKQETISTLSCRSVHKTWQQSTESDVNIHIGNTWSTIDWLSIIRKSDLSDEIKRDFFQAVPASIQLLWMHQMNSTEIHGEKARQELQKNSTCCLEQILKHYPQTSAVRSPTSHLTNHPNMTKKISRGTGVELRTI